MDERDLSMDSTHTQELQRILNIHKKTKLTRIGFSSAAGTLEVRQMNESAELKKFLEGLPTTEPRVCEGSGGYRIILCDECSGSHKCYTEIYSV